MAKTWRRAVGAASEALVVLGASALVVTLTALGHTPSPGPVVLFAALMLWAENAAVGLPIRVGISPGFMVAMAALVALDGNGAVLGVALVCMAGGLALRLIERREFRKLAFNCALCGLSAAAAAVVQQATAGWSGGSHLAAGVAYAAANVLLLLPPITLLDNVPARRIFAGVVAALPSYLAFGLLGVGVGLAYQRYGALAVLLLTAPLVVARSAYVALARQRAAYDRLEKLSHVSSALVETTNLTGTLQAAVEELSSASDAGEAVLLLRDGDRVVRTRREAAGDVTVEEVPASSLPAHESALLQVAVPELGDGLATMTAPVVIDDGVVGAIRVAQPGPSNAVFSGEDLQLFGTLVNQVTSALQRAQLVERLRYESLHDGLTGLGNRTLFRRRLEESISSGSPTGLLLVDLDGFKAVNDTLGHAHGDELLVAVAGRLQETLPANATVARLGGDEYAVVLPRHDSRGVEQVVSDVLQAVEHPFSIAGLQFELSASIGAACSPEDGADLTTLLHRADVALSSAKSRRSRWSRYIPADDTFSPRRLALVSDLRRAIDEDQLRLHYQPLVEPRSGRIEGVEALMRWRHPVHGELRPDEFIPIAEHTDLVHPMTRAALEMALGQAASWRRDGLDLRVAVNLSARNLLDPTLPARVALSLAAANVPADSLTLELTETAVMADPDRSIEVLRQLRTLGVRVAIDDFGTGYSSLSYLKHLPVDELKIDRSLISQLTSSTFDGRIVGSVIALGRDLGLTVVAEGVEDQATRQQLADLGCPLVQGYLFSRPVPPADIAPIVLSADAGFPPA